MRKIALLLILAPVIAYAAVQLHTGKPETKERVDVKQVDAARRQVSLTPDGMMWLNYIAPSESERASASSTIDGYLKQVDPSSKSIADEVDPQLKLWMTTICVYAIRGNIIAAQDLASEVGRVGAFKQSAFPGLQKFLTTATEPPDDDLEFIRANDKQLAVIADLNDLQGRSAKCANTAIRAEVYDDAVAREYVADCMIGAEYEMAKIRIKSQEMKLFMEAMRNGRKVEYSH